MNITYAFVFRFISQLVSMGLLSFSIAASAQSYPQPNVSLLGASTGGIYLGSSTLPGNVGSGSSPSTTYVQPHLTHGGSLVQGHYRTTPDGSTMNNFGTSGNYNPYTGAVGTRR